MEYEGADQRVRLYFPPSIPVISIDGGLLNVLRLCRLRLQPGYGDFRSGLKDILPLLDEPTLPTVDTEDLNAALEVLWTERERRRRVKEERGMQGKDEDEDEDEEDDREEMYSGGVRILATLDPATDKGLATGQD